MRARVAMRRGRKKADISLCRKRCLSGMTMDHADLLHCWLCEREIGKRVEWHHPVPKSRGGRQTVPVHPICHRTLHVTFTNAELAKRGADAQALKAEPSLTTFMRWIEDKPPDFHARTAKRKR
jgi:hypothetical protein